jgi:hypothetical protein
MQLCIENVDQAGGCAYGYACVYTDSISWSSPTEPLPVIRDPRVAFEKLFGVGGTFEERAARRRSRRSILDFVAGEMASLKRDLSPADRTRMDSYLSEIREVERRIQRIEARNESSGGSESRQLAGAPAGVPDSFEEHVKLMFDIQALAFAADITRLLVQDGARRFGPRVSGERVGQAVPSGVAPWRYGEGRERVLPDQQVSRQHAAVLTRQAEEHLGGREQHA